MSYTPPKPNLPSSRSYRELMIDILFEPVHASSFTPGLYYRVKDHVFAIFKKFCVGDPAMVLTNTYVNMTLVASLSDDLWTICPSKCVMAYRLFIMTVAMSQKTREMEVLLFSNSDCCSFVILCDALFGDAFDDDD